MKNYSSTKWETHSFKKVAFTLLVFLATLVTHVNAQTFANYTFTTNTTGSLVDMSTGTTQLIAPSLDAAASPVTPIGFSFPLMGTLFSAFSVNDDGLVQLGGSAVGTNIYTISGGTAAAPRLSAFNADLRTGTTGRVHYKVTGAYPNRQLVIEFLNMQVFYTGTPTAGTATYQVILSESTGTVSFIYGDMAASDIASGNRAPSIGAYTGAAAGLFVSVAYATNTATTTGTYTANPNVAATGVIANLNSAAQGARRVYEFTPPVPAAATALSFSAVTAVGMTLNWTDNATGEFGYAIFRSTDGITYSQVAQLAANAVTYNATLLNPNTTYFWKVLAYSEGAFSADLAGTQATLPGTISGIKTVGTGGDYTNLTTAFADINTQGLSGNVDLQLIAGYPATAETYPIASSNSGAVGANQVKVYPMVSGLSITSANTTGTLNLNSAANLTFDGRVNQAGAADLVIANTNVGASYAVQFVNDAKNNTLKYCIIQSTNNNNSSGTIVFAGTTGTTGNDNNTIDRCEIKDGATMPTIGIYSAGTSVLLDNSGNIVTNNNISNYFNAASGSSGILLSSNSSAWTIDANRFFQTATRTLTSGAVHRAINIITASGNGYVVTNNVIGYATAAGTGVMTYTASAGRFIGIEVTASNTGTATSIQGNTVTAVSTTTTSGTTAAPGIFCGISVLGGSANIGTTTPNIIGATSGTGAIAVVTSTNANVFGIHASSTGTLTIANNAIGSVTAAGSAAGVFCGMTGINTAGASTATTITGNTIGGATANSIAVNTSGVTTAASTFSGIATAGAVATLTVSNNTINNIVNYATGASVLNGIVSTGSPVTAVITNNTITNVALALGTVNGISAASPVTHTISGNTVSNASIMNATGTATINGIVSGTGATQSVLKNKIYNLNAGSAASAVNGILLAGGTTVNVYNNVIGDLKAPVASATDAIRGISITSTTGGSAQRIYYNTVYLNASSTGTNFGTTGIFHTANAAAGTAALDMRNNIIINQSTAAGTGLVVAFRRSSTALGNFASVSTRNMLYAGTPSATNLIMYDGTTAYQTMLSYQTLVAPREANSFSGEPFAYATPGSFFISLTGSSVDFLRPVAGITTQVESGGVNITTPAITDDYAGAIRAGNGGYAGAGTAPDLGAFEIAAISPTPILTLNSVTPPTTTQCVSTPRLVSIDVNPVMGTTVAVSIAYTANGVVQAPIAMVNTTGSTWEGTIPVPTPANATIAWGVGATNSIGVNGGYTGTPYADEPLFGSTASATATPAGPLCAGTATDVNATLLKSGTVQLGAAATTTGLTSQPTAFNNRFSSYRMQTIYTAAELTAAGLSAGPITAITYNIISLGSAATNANFTVKAGTTAQTVFTDFISSAGFTTVFTPATYTHAVGLNTITFTTPYNWDGVSNLVIEVSHDGANSSNNAETYYTATPGNTVAWSINGGATGTLSPNRLNIIFNGITAFPIQAISWSDGAATVGTTNPLSVTPMVTTTYTATLTAAGCAVTPSPTVTVTVNPLPSAPTAANSAQCGTQIPTASVTSTTGLPTPTFQWYDAAAAGTMLQSGTSATYTSNVAATTTFYVSELNTTTGCESARTAVTVTVASADGVSANAAPATICIGNTVTLTAANTNPTPLQSYTYSWSGPAGSGAETPVAGASVIITPTVPGTYTYNVNAVDGGCSGFATTSVTVDPFVTTLTAVDATCNGVANGSFTQGASTCGTLPYTYAVDGGAFGAIPTNLAAGTHSVIVKDANNFESSAITVTIGQPSVTTSVPTAPAVAVCENSLTAMVAASSVISTPLPGSITVPFDVAAQPVETNAAPGNIVASATYSLPAGATVTGGTLTYNGLTALGNSWMSDIRLGFSGAVVDPAFQGTGSTNAAGTLNYTRAIPAGAISAGGTVNLLYWDYFNDNTAGAGTEATFTTGTGVATLTINYTTPTPATISWWDASTGGTQLGTGSPFETVGTSVLPNTNTPGTYTVYAQGQNGACPSPGRTAVVITVKPKSTSTLTQTACDTYTLNGTTYNTSGTYTQVIPNALGCDSTITLNLTIKSSSASSMTQTACVSYTLNGTTYNTSGTYTQLFTNAVGCDSTLTLNLTINQPTTSTVTATACSSYTLNGSTYTVSGVYTQNLTNVAGCDSTLTLNLTINQPTTNTISATGCSSVTVNGSTYTVSGVYTQLFTNAVGCDSTLTINVTLNNTFNTITDVACGMYTYNGTDYTTSGTYMDTLTNMAGCDSIVTLNLTINQPTSSVITDVACSTYTLNGVDYTTSGVHTQVLTNAAGCDSTITLNLTINQPTTASMTVSECESFTYNGTTYTTSGTFTDVLTNAAGCDSVVTINLTIIGLPVATATDNANHTITASAGASYQWVHCATGLPIAGATAQTYTATVNGSYAVIVTNAGGCSDTSNCVTVSNIGIDELTDASIQVFPNPTHNHVTVTMSSANATLEVVDAQGKLLQAVTIVNGAKVDLSAYETGVYFLRIQTDNGSAVERIVKN